MKLFTLVPKIISVVVVVVVGRNANWIGINIEVKLQLTDIVCTITVVFTVMLVGTNINSTHLNRNSVSFNVKPQCDWAIKIFIFEMANLNHIGITHCGSINVVHYFLSHSSRALRFYLHSYVLKNIDQHKA